MFLHGKLLRDDTFFLSLCLSAVLSSVFRFLSSVFYSESNTPFSDPEMNSGWQVLLRDDDSFLSPCLSAVLSSVFRLPPFRLLSSIQHLQTHSQIPNKSFSGWHVLFESLPVRFSVFRFPSSVFYSASKTPFSNERKSVTVSYYTIVKNKWKTPDIIIICNLLIFL